MKKYLNYIISLGIVVLSLALYLLLEFEVIDFGTKYQIFWFFVFMMLGFGIFLTVKAVKSHNRFNIMMIAFGLFLLSLIYLLIAVTSLEWYIILIICIAFTAIMLILGMAFGRERKTDRALNEQPGYKTYNEKQLEKEKEEKKEEKLPELKSFKDDK